MRTGRVVKSRLVSSGTRNGGCLTPAWTTRHRPVPLVTPRESLSAESAIRRTRTIARAPNGGCQGGAVHLESEVRWSANTAVSLRVIVQRQCSSRKGRTSQTDATGGRKSQAPICVGRPAHLSPADGVACLRTIIVLTSRRSTPHAFLCSSALRTPFQPSYPPIATSNDV